MESFSSSIAGLEKLVKQLMELHSQAIKQNATLKLNNEQLQIDKQESQNKIANLTDQLKTLKLAQALTGSGDQDSRQMKTKINEYIKEIDKCLALLNN